MQSYTKRIPLLKLILTICFGVLFISPAPADMTYRELMERSGKINRNLDSFKAGLRIRTFFMGLTIPLRGHLYYRKPDRMHLSIPSIPSSLKNKRGVIQQAIPHSFKADDYNGTILGTEQLNEKVLCFLLQLLPLNNPKIEKIHLWIDTNSFLILKSKIFYPNNSSVTSMQNYRREGKFILPDRQLVEFNLPQFKADVMIDYQEYSVNIPVDEIFTKKEEME